MQKKIILLYPYFNGISGAFNRYLLLEKLFKRTNIKVKLIVLKDKRSNSAFTNIFNKLFKFIQVESIIFFYSVLRNYYFITDFNPSIVALFSKNVLIQIHDVSWENKLFARHNIFFYKLLKVFIKYYSNIITVSKTSMIAICKVSMRKKRTFYLYNSVSKEFIIHSNKIGQYHDELRKNNIPKSIKLNLPNILYIATLTPRKSHLDLLSALSKTNKFLNINLVGLPSDKRILELIKNKINERSEYINFNINYFPKLSQKDLCDLLIYSSAYISTSLYEGFGIPVLEANLYNLPLIIRDLDINRELFPKAKFFKSNLQLSNFLNDLEPLSDEEFKKRKTIALNMQQDNLIKAFNYLTLSQELKSIILSLK